MHLKNNAYRQVHWNWYLIKHFHFSLYCNDTAKLLLPALYYISYIYHNSKETDQWNKAEAIEKKHLKNTPDIPKGF